MKQEMLELLDKRTYEEFVNAYQKRYGAIELSQARPFLISYYAWAITHEHAIKIICEQGPITEIGAGGGYWAYRIQEAGGDIQALDAKIPVSERTDIPELARKPFSGMAWESERRRFWMPIEKCSTGATAPEDRALMLCWPNCTPMAYNCIKHYKGDTVIYIGEPIGGNCGDRRFHETLLNYWDLKNQFDIHSFPGMYDDLFIFKRRESRKLTRQQRRKIQRMEKKRD